MNIHLDMVGCRLNQSEIESLGQEFRLAGHNLVSQPSQADLVVINTCTVTAAAASDSRQKVRQALKAGAGQVVVTGCYATLEPEQLRQLSGAVRVVGNAEKDRLVSLVLGLPDSDLQPAPLPRLPIPGSRLRTRAFIKVQDGCDNFCTYCITRLARGKCLSRPAGEVLAGVDSALQGGCQEIVLTGVHLGAWGSDFDPPSHLQHLLETILTNTQAPRVHLSSIEPWDITPNFLSLWQDARLCRHLHLPLQSGCAATLKRMGRKVTPVSYSQLVQIARRLVSGVAITTDIITGFPGESQAEFEDSLAFVQQMQFAGGHVFTYSPRPGTPAAQLPGQVPPPVAKRRNALMRQVLQSAANAFRQQHIGQELSVLWEKATPIDRNLYRLSGISDNNLRVHAISSTPCLNHLMPIRITGLTPEGLLGEILPIPPQASAN